LAVKVRDLQCLYDGVRNSGLIYYARVDDSTTNPSPLRYNTNKSEFEDKSKGQKFGESRENLIFNSFQHATLKNVYVPCSTKYDLPPIIGIHARKPSIGAINYSLKGESRPSSLLVVIRRRR
jgi:hypothetical protein